MESCFRGAGGAAMWMGETMRFVTKRLAAIGAALLFCAPLFASGTHKPASKTERKPAATKPAAKKPAPAKAPVRKAAPGKKAASSRKTVKPDAPAPAALRSPIRDNALEAQAQPDKPGEVKARTVPNRAYAVDGQTFFYQGRKYRVAGLKGNDNSDMAKQRLQRALESGDIALDPAQSEEAGITSARVRINGRDIANDLN